MSSGQEVDLIIGSRNSYQQPYDPAGSVSAFHNLPRFGHTSDLSAIFSLEGEDIEEYSKGLIFLGAFLITFFCLWLLVVAIFKCLGYKNVGFLSGHGFIKHSTSTKVIRSIFLFSSLMIVLFSIFLATLGMNGFQTNALSTFDEINTEVQAILDQFSVLIDSHSTVGEEAMSLRISLDEFLSQDVCPSRPGTVSEQNIREFSSEARGKLLALEDFIGADLEDVKTVVDETRGISDEVGILLQEAEEATNGKVYAFVVPMIFLALAFITALTVAWKNKSVQWLRVTVSWVVLPLFIVGVLISLFACVGVATSAEANADFCSGGEEETPEATIMAIMDESGARKDLLGYQIAVFYMFQCSGTENPFTFLSTYNIDLQSSRKAIQNYESEIQQQTVEELNRSCGVNYQPVYDDLVSIATKTDALIGLAQEGIEVISCANIVPLYIALVHEATCNDSMKAQVWAFTSLLLITFFGMIMVTLRASYQTIGIDEKDNQGSEKASFGNVVASDSNASISTQQVVVTVERAFQGQKLGIGVGMTSDNGTYHVTKITPDSPFWSTKLEEGMEIQKINGLDLKEQSMNVVMMLLLESMSITIVAQSTGTETSTSPTVLNITSQHTVDDPLPSLSCPRPPDFDEPPQSTSETKIHYLERPKTGSNPAALTPTRHMVTVVKEQKDQKLGITLARDPQGHFTVSVLSPASPFLIMGLEVGMRVISINDVEITGQQMDDVLGLMKESIGEVTVIAEEMPKQVSLPPPSTSATHSTPVETVTPMTYAVHKEPEFSLNAVEGDTGFEVGQKSDVDSLPVAKAQLLDTVHSLANNGDIPTGNIHQGTTIRAVCTRSSGDEKLGVSLKRDQNGVYTVSDVLIDSPFRGTGLAVGMRVTSINRIEVTGQDMGVVTTIMQNAVGEVTIEATEQENSEWF